VTGNVGRREAPYRRIVAELRRRIETGELAPGAKVPSTRAITREWGVAMATATKVLTELRHEGLVRALPGVGTVVADVEDGRAGQDAGARRQARAAPAPARAPAPPVGGPLVPDRVVRAAISVADAEGLDAVSMRRIAAELGVATMSLYRHVADKDDLLLHMMDTVFSQWPLPEAGEGARARGTADAWRARLESAGRTLWAMFRRHPWLAPAMSVTRPQAIPTALRFTESILAALEGHGLDAGATLTIHLTLFNYTRGTAINLEAEAAAQAATGMDSEEWLEGQEQAFKDSLVGDELPLFRRLLDQDYDFDLDALFEFGLQRLLDGIAPLLTPAPE
jgi:DNA-binding transcriptional regulator YhcF (GntR family)/AcrR family transcriptional regulator